MTTPKTTKLAAMVSDERARLGLSHRELANLMCAAAQAKNPAFDHEGISDRTLKRIEEGEKRALHHRTARAIAAYFVVSPQHILDLNDEEE